MLFLLFVSLLWAFSFGLIKTNLTGLDASFVASARLLLSALAFLPFLRLKGLPRALRLRLIGIGAVQYGIMYLTYTAAFQYLQAYEAALFTLFTPLYVTLIHDLFERRFSAQNLALAGLALLGTGIVVFKGWAHPAGLTGFLLMQISNLSFAFGQVRYRSALRCAPQVRDSQVFALLYAGGFAAAALPALFSTNWAAFSLSLNQGWTLAYLGLVASGLGFFLWNLGARRTDIAALAIFNDLKIPLSVAVSLIFFGETANLPRLLIGGAVILAALWASQRRRQQAQA